MTKEETTVVSGTAYLIKSLKDRTQFCDPNGKAAELGITNTTWPISGMLWPAGIVLANLMSTRELTGLRILEVGCGIGLASLVAQSKGADITASDYHPITQTLLDDNAELNNLPSLSYFRGDWRNPITNQGKFDLIIGSDLLYDRSKFENLATFVDCHLSEQGHFLLIDPKRRNANRFIKIMTNQKLDCEIQDQISRPINGDFFRYKSFTFYRQ